jgi:uncharacterized membrane protein
MVRYILINNREMDLIKLFLRIHILSGAIVLLTGLLQIILPKIGRRHRILGRVYFYSMSVVFITSIILCFFDTNMQLFGRIFLGVVALFSYYSAVMGMRFGKLKVLSKPLYTDKVISTLGVLSWLFMLGIGIWCAMTKNYIPAAILGVFSFIFGMAVIVDFRRLVILNTTEKLYDPKSWMLNHAGRILGSYIAAITAFCVNVSPFPMGILNWLVPTAMGFILIPLFMRKVRRMIGEKP